MLLKLFANKSNIPKIKSELAILDPTTVPSTKEEAFELKRPNIDVHSSGSEVPIATIVRPITNLEIPALFPKIEALRTR